MINCVGCKSGVAFKANAGDKVTPEMISRPGSYEKQDSAEFSAKTEKKGGFLKSLAGIVVAAAVVLGGLVMAAKKGWTKALPAAVEGAEAPKWTAKLSDKLNKAGEGIEKFFVENWNKIFKKKEKGAEAVAVEVKPTVVEEVVAEVV